MKNQYKSSITKNHKSKKKNYMLPLSYVRFCTRNKKKKYCGKIK